ncbi:BPSS1780 family membrane protein [Sphaerotilaceae bacterium SBD11-9]
MQLRLVPPGRGALWVRQGFRIFFARPFSFMGLFGMLLLGMVVAQLIPWVGPLLFSASLPLITLGFMRGTHQALQGRFPTPGIMFAPLRGPHARPLWQLGAIYAACMFAVALVYIAIDGGRMQAFQTAALGEKATPEALAERLSDGRLQLGFLWFAGATTLLSLPFWHAPALVFWGGQSAGKAMFFSTVACWRNKWAFAVYGLTGMGIVMGFALASSLLFALIGAPGVAPLVMMPAVLLFTAVFYASLFFTFADCFEAPPETPAPEKEPAP